MSSSACCSARRSASTSVTSMAPGVPDLRPSLGAALRSRSRSLHYGDARDHRHRDPQSARHQIGRVPGQSRRDAAAVGRRRRRVGERSDDRRTALRRPPPPSRQDARPRAHRGADRSRHAVPRAEPARRLGHPGPRRRRQLYRHRHRRGRRVCDQRLGHDLPRRLRQPDHVEEGIAVPRDRPREPAAGDRAQRVRRRRPAPPGRPVHPGRWRASRTSRSSRRWGSRRSRWRSGRTPPAARTRRG